MLFSVNDARQLALNFLKNGNIPEAEAEIITEILLESELRGRKTHGFIRLSGALVKAAVIPPPGVNYGMLLIVINPSIFLPLDEFKQKITELVDAVKNTTKMDGVAEILVPGERAWRERAKRMETGIELDDDLVEQLGRW